MFVINYRKEQRDGTIIDQLIYKNITPFMLSIQTRFVAFFLLGGRGTS